MRMTELISNTDGRLSTTSTIQFFGFLGGLAVLLVSVWLDKPYVPDLYSTFLFACVGTAATKGAVDAYRSRGSNT